MSLNTSMDPNFPNEYRRSSHAGQVFLFLLVLAIVVAALSWMASRPANVELKPHGPAPTITAAGWLNGKAPTKESLAGKVVVVEVWATWCHACLKMMPHLVEVHDRFADRGVVFIGLTSEDEGKLPVIERVLRNADIRWPIGWGADQTIRELGTEYLPSLYVIGSNGQILWTNAEDGEFSDVLEQALRSSNSRL
jgi:thiol-disulfide isomerase/thioredoxin